MNPDYTAAEMNKVPRKIRGKQNNRISDIHHPLKKAKNNPEKHIPNDINICPNFSPTPFCMAWHSLLSLAGSSVALLLSNHSMSYVNIALRYATFVFFPILSLTIVSIVKKR